MGVVGTGNVFSAVAVDGKTIGTVAVGAASTWNVLCAVAVGLVCSHDGKVGHTTTRDSIPGGDEMSPGSNWNE